MAYPVPSAPSATNLDAFSGIISGNRRPKGEITIEARAAIIAAVQAGDKKRHIAQRFGISSAAIHRTLHRFEKTGQLASRPRSGRPRTKVRKHDAFKPKTGPRPLEGLGFRHVEEPQMGAQPVAPGPVAPLPVFVAGPGETRPSTPLSDLTATLHPTTYVFASFRDPSGLPPMPQIQLFFQEPEGITIVTSLGYARAHRMECFFPCRMISLSFTSSAEAAGHTAVLVARLAARNLGVKPVSGFYHDHLLVPAGREGEAMEVLAAVAEEHRGKIAATARGAETQPTETQTEEAQFERAQSGGAQPEEAQPQEPQEPPRAQGQDREAQPEANQPEAEDAEEEEEEEELELYGNEYDSEAHQCSEVDSQDEDALEEDAPEEDTPEQDPAKE